MKHLTVDNWSTRGKGGTVTLTGGTGTGCGCGGGNGGTLVILPPSATPGMGGGHCALPGGARSVGGSGGSGRLVAREPGKTLCGLVVNPNDSVYFKDDWRAEYTCAECAGLADLQKLAELNI